MTVAVADTPAQRRLGLMRIESLPDGLDGMLFVFETARSASFHMRDTLMPLDIWWFDEGGRLVGSTEMEPCPAEPCESYPSLGEVAWALETPSGEVDLEIGAALSTGESP